MLLRGKDAIGDAAYERHRPEQTLLYQIVEAHYPALIDLLGQQGKCLPDHARREFDAYLWGVVYGTKAFLPYLKQQSQAHIVNVSSLFGLVGAPQQCAYNASKFAIRGFTESLRQEMAGSNLGVSCVHPGGIATAIVESGRFADGSDKDAALEGIEKLGAPIKCFIVFYCAWTLIIQ
jgi:NAD(P)-dependent dehydrogenase (short-subunit alcohol dehydrogenase family)